MKLTILGETTLRVGAAFIPLGARKQRALLALLLLNVRRPVPVDTLVQVLWPGKARDQVRGTVQVQVSRIRKAFKDSGVKRNVVIKDGDGYRLDLDQDLVDYHYFRKTADSGRAASAIGDHFAAKARLTEAIDLWSGVPLADVEGDWAEHRRDSMESTDLLHAYHALFHAEIHLREYAEVLRDLVPLMERHPLDGTLALQRMKALDGMGDRHGATAFYSRYRQRHSLEFGLEPSAELSQFYLRLLDQGAADVRPASDPLPLLHAFPRASGRFSGRGELLAKLDGFLRMREHGTTPMVALHGMPGVGKTQLAIHWAHRHRADFPDGQVLLDMRGYGQEDPLTADNAISQLLDRLGVPTEQIPAEPERRPMLLSRTLLGREVLLVIDNVRDSEQVRPLVSAVPDAFVLFTSRDRLRGLTIREGVHPVAVPELSTAESVELLRSTIHDARATDDEPGLLDIAALSGGLPLALKIVGQHVADRPLETLGELTEQLRAQRDLFSVHDEDDELLSLPAVFSWSYQALAPQTARVFRFLGLHPGSRVSGHTTAALANITPDEATKHLNLLVRVNLLDTDVASRYRFHDLLHEYAGDCVRQADLSADRRDAVERLLTWYVETSCAVSRRLSPQSQPVPPLDGAGALPPLSFATDKAALDWCLYERGSLVAATRLAATTKGMEEQAWRLPAALREVFERSQHIKERPGYHEQKSGYHDDMVTCHELVLASAARSTLPEAEMGTRNNLGLMYLSVGRLNDAYLQFQASLERAREVGHEPCEAAVLHNLGIIHAERGDDHEALRHHQGSLAINRRLGAHEGEAFAFHRIGMAYHRLSNFDDARAAYLEALRLRLDIGHVRGQGSTLTALAALHHELGEPSTGLEYCLQALRAHQTSGDQVETCHALAVRAAIEFDLGEFEAAREHAEHAMSLADQLQDALTQVKSRHLLGHLSVVAERPQDAIVLWRQALALVPSPNDVLAATIRADLESADPR
ncbi:AfsR/SARP family transcriptional regulator [Lentzea cavernae]|uniref:SARP family transcriptional regulator n=1 Tax=Lentzea cavernae TaxID=2020703 RepID=A0ABQ3MLF0_9PSEU|nr:tetratricopeptide repeat protein [Lentzea cavernae]GHH48019.1 SARP family transcriptional regulator [Lentzea cavernae]